MKIKGDVYMDNKLEEKYDSSVCSAVSYQDINVCVPVTIKAFGEVANIEIECLGKPIINSNCHECQNKSNSTCKFTISQKLRVTVPVVFDAKAETGEASVGCECTKEENNWHCSKNGHVKKSL